MHSIKNFNLPPGKSCPNCNSCIKECYAMKAWKQYPSVRESWGRNFRIANDSLEETERQIEAKLSRSRPEYFRIHSSGDFYSQEYYDMWVRIAEFFPDTNFLAFTKSAFDYADKPDNLSIVISLFPSTDQVDTDAHSHLPRAYADGMEKHLHHRRKYERVHECPYNDHSGDCDSCKLCWHLKPMDAVHFDKH